eukprot:190945-Chlamydomonas_euryale.AAC.4
MCACPSPAWWPCQWCGCECWRWCGSTNVSGRCRVMAWPGAAAAATRRAPAEPRCCVLYPTE